MLIRVLRALTAAFGVSIVSMTLLGPVAAADENCDPIVNPDGTVTLPCEEGGGGGGGDDEEGGGDGGGGTPRECRHGAETISCNSEYGSWDGRCYVRTANPQPEPGSGAWEGHDDGYILECTPYVCAQAGGDLTDCPGHSFYWSPDAPAPPGPSAEELARRAVATMQLTMGQIGSTPPASTSDPNAVGAIGLPIWLWIADRAENTIGPITRTASDGGLSVSATGTLDRVEWTLTSASGATVGAITCDGANAPGTPYDGRNSAEPSPTCGFGADLNTSPGDLTLTGTAYWVVDWQGGGQSGQIDVPAQSNSTQIRIGEVQALVRD
jgi:hypothetical protein